MCEAETPSLKESSDSNDLLKGLRGALKVFVADYISLPFFDTALAARRIANELDEWNWTVPGNPWHFVNKTLGLQSYLLRRYD